jgi:hypothetical protein
MRKQDMPHSLLWKVIELISKPLRPASYRAPSWSWASLDASITYLNAELQDSAPGEIRKVIALDIPKQL